MEEIWRDIYEYEGKYQVSNMGRVRSLDFTSMQPHSKTGEIHPYTYTGRMLKPHAINSGYLAVGLRDQQGKRQHLVHRLVAAAFIPNPNDLPVVNHKNEDKTDNRAENLEWCTNMYNNHYGNAQRKLSETHTNHPNLSKPVFQKDKDGCLVNMFPSAAEASRQTGIPQSAIVRCCNGEKYYKSAGGYLWEYIPE